MEIKSFIQGIYSTNNYLLINNNQAVMIDASGSTASEEYAVIQDYLNKHNLELKAVLITHGHFDHIGLGKYYQDMGVPIYIHRNDSQKTKTNENLSAIANMVIDYFDANICLDGGEVLELIGLEIKVLHTPGHTSGCVCYQVGDVIFSGDTLFYQSIGRTDLYDGDFDTIIESIQLLLNLDGDCVVYPGHGKSTTLSHERKYNPHAKI